ncbi:protein-cysteine N-palmitoyltransferase Rasp isoform X2 [Sitophilus oryzae]|uniref:Protein-cysteine N-palmitoyltransferase Rasp isoform X2 n=1 Tax=Sitophilus oryzae TaxID=7048 RepID=A0A6J2XJ76_SITOR|nr:protein-cysteine N-palmitoyltransferase Rasp isoform X2 [Sitophilus oryzae]
MNKQLKFQHLESKLCLMIWISSICYAIYQYTTKSHLFFLNYADPYNDFEVGWNILNNKRKDKSDFEWESIGFIICNVYPFLLIYIFTSEFLRSQNFSAKNFQYFQVLFTCASTIYLLGYKILVIIFIQLILFSIVFLWKNKALTWLCSLTCLTLITFYKNLNSTETFLKFFALNHYEAYLNILVLCWLNLKCTSFSVSCEVNMTFLDYISYCFYFPTFITGPFISYNDFKMIYKMKEYGSLDVRLRQFLKNTFRWVLWYQFGNICLHFIYINATSFQSDFVRNLDLWSLCGYGYILGQFFHIKYVVLYGLSTSLASFENINVPSLPRCIGRIHLYSDMWKYFDPGLYNFLKSCIFIPLQNLIKYKFISSFVCFAFVYFWHGTEQYVLIWATLNYVGVSLEALFYSFYKKWIRNVSIFEKIDSRNSRRLKNILAAPLLALSAISNFYFFAGSIFSQIVLLMILYCCCEISTEFRDTNAHTM